MPNKKLRSLALAILLASSSMFPVTAAAAGQNKTAGAASGIQIQPRKSQLKESASEYNPVRGKAIIQKNNSLLEKKISSKLKTAAPNKNTYQTDELIVQYKKHTDAAKMNALSVKLSLKQTKQLPSVNAEVVKIPKGTNAADYTKKLKSDPSVEYVQPNYTYVPTDTNIAPNYYSQLWGINNTGQSVMGSPGMRDVDVDAPEARTNYNGKLKTVLVGVLDTGIDINHPDLKNAIWTNPGEIPNDGIDNDHDGYVDDVHGWDFYNKDNSVFDPLDGDEHGTHVSGIIAGSMEGTSYDSNKGIVGAAPNVKIVPLKFMGPYGGDTAGAIAAIEYAQKLGIKIINCSWGGPDNDQLLKQAIQNYNGLFIVAAGNDGANNDLVKTYPADFGCTNIISVAAIDNQGNLADFSNYGANSVDIAAPGVNILSTFPKFPADEVEKMLGIQQLGAAAQVSSPQLNYKAIFDGLGYEKYTGTERTDAFTKAMNFLDIPKDMSKKILLVQDDEHDFALKVAQDEPDLVNYLTNYLPIYQNLLKGYTYKTITIASDSSIKNSGVDLSSYDAVIWFTGHGMGINASDGTALTTDDVSALTNYLNGGGHLLLTGQDALGGNEDSSFVTNLLHLDVYSNMGPSLNVEGLAGGIYSGEKYTINHFDDIFPASDFIQANNPETTINLKYVSDYSQAYNYESGTSMATPFVTGAAAILLGLNPDMPPKLIKLYITSKGKKLPQLEGVVNSGEIVKESKLNSFSDNILPGVPLTENRISGYVNATSDKNDIYALSLKKGEEVNLNLSGKSGTDFDLYVYNQSAKNVNTANDMAAHSENPGTSNEAITFKAPYDGIYFIDVYAYKGAGSYKLNVGNFGGTYEDDSKLLSKTGSWATIKNQQFSNGSAVSLNSSGEMDFAFIGTNFVWQGFKDPSQGIADIYIDGIKEASPSLFASKLEAKQSIFKKAYSYYGKHYVRIVWTGKASPAARKNAAGINIDRFIVKSIPNAVNVRYDSAQKHPIVSWTAASWASSYNVYRKEAADKDFKKLNAAPVAGLSFTDTTAKFGKTYEYEVSINKKGTLEETGLSSPSGFIFDDDISGHINAAKSSVSGSLNVAAKDVRDVWSKKLEKGKTYKFDLKEPVNSDFMLNLYNIGTATIYGKAPLKNAAATIIFKPAKTGIYYLVPTAKKGAGVYKLDLSVLNAKKNKYIPFK